MTWLLVVLAGLFETAFAVSLKASAGFTKLLPTLLFLVFSAGSFGLLALALRTLPVGTAYAVWTGVGAAGTAVIGMAALGEPVTLARVLSIALVAGVVGLQLTSSAH